MEKIDRYYFYEESSKIVYYSEELPEGSQNLIYIGTSDNPNPRMAIQAFLQNGIINTGYRIRRIN